MYASPFHSSATQYPAEFIPSPPLSSFSRPITSCLPCRSRKVKCDRRQPLCLVCERGDYTCSYVSKPQSKPQAAGLVSGMSRITKPKSAPKISSSTLARINPGLQRLGNFMAQAKAYEASEHSLSTLDSSTPTRSTPAPHNRSPPEPRSQEDALILDNGVPHFVSGRHWAWMAAELNDIQSVLAESQNSSPEPVLEEVILDADSPVASGDTFWPDTREDCYLLLNVFLTNFDPIHRIVHRPSLTRRFDAFVRANYHLDNHPPPVTTGSSSSMISQPKNTVSFEPLAMSIFYAAVNSMKDTDVSTMFGTDKSYLLNRYRTGTEVHLKRHKFMTSRIFEVLQAFVILLTAQYREDDMGKVGPLTGLAIRVATVHGLHRDPLALPLGTMDVVQVELRRRLWAQICYLDFRTTEDHGFAPSIHESDFDTRRPLSVDDVDLIEGAIPSAGLSDAPKFTDMTIYLLRITTAQYYGRIFKMTHASRNRLHASIGPVGEAEALAELQDLLNNAESLADEFEKNLDDLVRYCDKRVSMQSMALDLRDHLKNKFWVMFWIRVSRQDREKVIGPVMRRRIFVDAATAIENWCTIASGKACEPFQWHIYAHAGFSLILYVLSELRSPGFQSPEWADLRQRGLQLANSIYEIRGQHTTGAWPAIIWLVNRIRGQQGLGSGIANDQPAGTGLSDNNNPMSTDTFAATRPGSAGTGLDTPDFMGMVNLEDFDFADFASLDPMWFHGLSQKTYDSTTDVLRVLTTPTAIHNCIQPWLYNQLFNWGIAGAITRYGEEMIHRESGTTLQIPSSPYRTSRKEPDFLFMIHGRLLPIVAVESGWSETMPRLQNDLNMFHTLTIDFVTGLPRTKKGLDAVAIYTCKSTKRIGSTPGKKTWKGYDWATAILQDLQKGDWGIPVVWISDRDKHFVEGFFGKGSLEVMAASKSSLSSSGRGSPEIVFPVLQNYTSATGTEYQYANNVRPFSPMILRQSTNNSLLKDV
ncbi:hypothetical protein PENPOL_c004G05978 [Penicillium polonicum]|uniref:Zn(2)-C6 fungal-type domain-containing protein n=1 Tax=Penicillium polonicum TaxID=60169 RepID=A0A1V6NQP1_PENPO|nr:hypothetical protein PENPOL_c004G05978 [Penicillium polonicum]